MMGSPFCIVPIGDTPLGKQGLRQAVVDNENSSMNISAHGGDEDVEHAGSDMRRMFRM